MEFGRLLSVRRSQTRGKEGPYLLFLLTNSRTVCAGKDTS
nr:MAG TPA: hypothetical protein [Caudoviricetes sp.]